MHIDMPLADELLKATGLILKDLQTKIDKNN